MSWGPTAPPHTPYILFLLFNGGGGGPGAPVLNLPLILLHFLVFYKFFFISHEEVNIFKCIHDKTS